MFLLIHSIDDIQIDQNRWSRAKIDCGPPYRVGQPEKGPSIGKVWWVEDKTGINVLSCLTKPGAIFTDKDTATKLVEIWNQK